MHFLLFFFYYYYCKQFKVLLLFAQLQQMKGMNICLSEEITAEERMARKSFLKKNLRLFSPFAFASISACFLLQFMQNML